MDLLNYLSFVLGVARLWKLRDIGMELSTDGTRTDNERKVEVFICTYEMLSSMNLLE